MEGFGRRKIAALTATAMAVEFIASASGDDNLGDVLLINEGDSPPELKLSIACPTQEIIQGDPIPIEFTITNIGEVVYHYMDRDYDRSGRMSEFELRAELNLTESIGVPIRDVRADYMGGICGGISGNGELQPGESFSKTIELHRWARLDGYGEYTVRGIYHGDPYRSPDAKVVDLTCTSEPITITVKRRSEKEMLVYIKELTAELQSRLKHERNVDDVICRMAYTHRMETLPAIIDSMYAIPASKGYPFWQVEALQYYLPDKKLIAQSLYEVGMKRGLAQGIFSTMITNEKDAPRVLFPLIQKSLEPGNHQCWWQGATMAQRFPDDRHSKRLAKIAMSEKSLPIPVIYALGNHRTDESVEALKKLLGSDIKRVRDTAEQAVRHAYIYRHANSPGRAMKPTDFPKWLQREKAEELEDSTATPPAPARLIE